MFQDSYFCDFWGVLIFKKPFKFKFPFQHLFEFEQNRESLRGFHHRANKCEGDLSKCNTAELADNLSSEAQELVGNVQVSFINTRGLVGYAVCYFHDSISCKHSHPEAYVAKRFHLQLASFQLLRC